MDKARFNRRECSVRASAELEEGSKTHPKANGITQEELVVLLAQAEHEHAEDPESGTDGKLVLEVAAVEEAAGRQPANEQCPKLHRANPRDGGSRVLV